MKKKMPSFKLDVCSPNVGELMLSISIIKVGVCSNMFPILGEHICTFKVVICSPILGEHMSTFKLDGRMFK